MQPIFHSLASVKPHGQANLADGLLALNLQLRRKSLIIVASDWMEDPELWGPSLEFLAASGHDIRCLHFFARREWDMDLPESVKIYGFEDRLEQPLDTSAMKELFAVEVQRYLSEVEQWSGRANAIWERAALEDELLGPLIALVRGRQK